MSELSSRRAPKSFGSAIAAKEIGSPPYRRLEIKNGKLVVRTGSASVGQAPSNNNDRNGSGGVHPDESDKSFTVRALRARSNQELSMKPVQILEKLHLYSGCGNGGVRSLIQHALVGEGVSSYCGYVLSSDNLDNIEKLLADLTPGGALTILNMASKQLNDIRGAKEGTRQSGEATYMMGDRGFAYVQSYGPTMYSCSFDFLNFDITAEERLAFDAFQVREDAKKVIEQVQKIYMLVDYGNGDFNFHSNKIPLSSFKADNYSKENAEWMPKLKEGLFSPTSTGRLSILQGPAGTGKTRYLRALMQELGDDTAAVVLPVSMAGELSHPRMLGQITANDDFEDKNLLLVIEDGDGLLEKRDRASSVISDFLNIVDGLVGEIINLHVVVTTNLQKKDFDPAITRPGRLHSILYFEALPAEQAKIIYKRETGEELNTTQPSYTLAEVYALSLNHKNGVREKKLGQGAGQYL